MIIKNQNMVFVCKRVRDGLIIHFYEFSEVLDYAIEGDSRDSLKLIGVFENKSNVKRGGYRMKPLRPSERKWKDISEDGFSETRTIQKVFGETYYVGYLRGKFEILKKARELMALGIERNAALHAARKCNCH